ncbi:MAG TPA: hypothetical protein VGL93_25825, partial [Streptosporangiaceae bacterium]
PAPEARRTTLATRTLHAATGTQPPPETSTDPDPGTSTPRGTHAAPEGGPRSVRARGVAWVGRHRAPAAITAISTAFALVASVAGWNALRDRGDAASPAPVASNGHVPAPRTPSDPRHARTHDPASPVTVGSTPAEHPTHRHHHTDARTPGHRHATPAAPHSVEPPATAKPHRTLLRDPGGSEPPRVIPALPRL